MEERPIGGFILSLLGGVFVVLGTIMGLVFVPAGPYAYAPIPNYYYPFLLTTAVCGALVLLGAMFLYWHPTLHVIWGVVVLVFAGASTVGVITGYYALFGLAGAILGVVGGAVSIAWSPGGTPGAGLTSSVRLCPACGRFVPAVYPFCPYCRSPAPTATPPGATSAWPPGVPPNR